MGWSSSLAKTLNSIGWNACALALQVAVYRPRISFGKTKGIRLAIGNCGPKFEIGQGFEHVAILLTHSCRLIVPVNPHFVVEQSNGDKAILSIAFLCQKTSSNSMQSFAWGALVAAFRANQRRTHKTTWQVRQEPRSAKAFFAVLTGRLLPAGTEPSCESVSTSGWQVRHRASLSQICCCTTRTVV